MTTLQPVSITSLSPVDLEHLGFDTSALTQDDLQTITRKMAHAYIENCFWDDLEIIADAMNIPRIE